MQLSEIDRTNLFRTVDRKLVSPYAGFAAVLPPHDGAGGRSAARVPYGVHLSTRRSINAQLRSLLNQLVSTMTLVHP